MADLEIESQPVECDQTNGVLTNGVSNGDLEASLEHKEKHHKSSSKDKHQDKDKDRHKSSHKDKDRHSSHKSSHKDRDKDKERSRDKEREKEKSSSDRDRHRSDKDRKDRDKDRHRSGKHSSSSKHDRDRSHSSHKSSHKDKHKDRHHDKERSKHKESSSEMKIKVEHEESSSIPEGEMDSTNIKQEMNSSVESSKSFVEENDKDFSVETTNSTMIKDEDEEPLLLRKRAKVSYMEEDDDDDVPLVQRKKVKKEEETDYEDDDDDVPLVRRKKIKKEFDHDEDDDDIPLSARKKIKSEKKRKIQHSEDDDDDDFKAAKKTKTQKVKSEKGRKVETESPTKGKKKKEEEENVWKWWEEEKKDDGTKWSFLEHKGPVFADGYERLPSDVKFYYNGKHMKLSENTEEVCGFYAKMLDHDYTTKEVFNKNFFKDWRKTMTADERETIVNFSKCDFRRIHAYYVQKNEERKNRTKEEKKELKLKNEAIIAEYGWCTIDGHRQRIGNFKIEPPGLFRGRGEHPKQGMVKRRTMPEDVIINCSKNSAIPKPPQGHKWKQVRHDPSVTWLACWNENIQGSTKYVMLNAASKLKGEKDWQKYETARRLHKLVDSIRENYKADWKSKEMRIRQRGVALYFIDKLALRAGNEKDEDQADTVGCCSLRYEHLTLHEKKDDKEFVVVFDFLGKDSIRYYNEVSVEKRVFKNLHLFMENKQKGDDIFDRLNTQIMNKYLNELMEGLTAKVFRTYNASRTLQEQLEKLTLGDDPIPAQILSYNRANREVAILCNHQRAVPKTFDQSMANLQKKINDKKDVVRQAQKELKDLKKAAKHGGSVREKTLYDKKKKAVERLKEQLDKLEISQTDKEENKQIALGTSKLNYLDPRITVAWCKKNNIPVDKVYNKTQRQKFQWAIDMATADFNFMDRDENQKFSRNGSNDGEDFEEEEDD